MLSYSPLDVVFVNYCCLLVGRYVQNAYIVFGVIGFLVGMSSEDLLFKDWNVVQNNCHKTKLIDFMRHTTDINPYYN